MNKQLVIISILLLFFHLSELDAQKNNCKKFHLYGPCMQYSGPGFKYDGQSRSNIIGFGDKLIYNMVFYGERQYKIYFCTSDEFYPIHVKLIDPVTRELLYDNKEDDYQNTMTLNIDKTRRILIDFTVLAHDASNELKMNYLGCSGVLMEWKKLED